MMTKNNQRQSILPPEMHGVVHITGYPGIGKSTLASEADLPQNIAYIDFESKARSFHEQLNFGLYRDLNEEAHDNLHMYQLWRSLIDKEIKPNQFTILVIDNVSELETAYIAEVKSKPGEYGKAYGIVPGNIVSGSYGGPQAVRNRIINEDSAKLHALGIHLIIVISHLSAPWKGGIPVEGKYNIKGSNSWRNLSILTLILIPSQNPLGVPDAIVSKESLATHSIDVELTQEDMNSMMRGNTGHVTRRKLPRRIPDCTFQKVRWYLYNPANLENPADGEVPREEEIDPFSNKLKPAQMEFHRLAMESELRRQEEDKQAEDELLDIIADNLTGDIETLIMSDATLSPPQLVEKLKLNGHSDVTIPQVAQALAKLKDK